MTGHRILAGSDARLRIAPWRGDATVAHVTPGRASPTRAAVERALDALVNGHYTTAVTAALPRSEQRPFLEAGFEVHEQLHLLRRGVSDLPPVATTATLRRGHLADHPAVLAVDRLAFPLFWRLDDSGLRDALDATPSARLRVAGLGTAPDTVAGYAITGRAGPRGYLQRLAVVPSAQREGMGTALVVDGLRWFRRWGAKEVLVNTQEGNADAVRLYERLGFEMQPEGLAVLRRAIRRPPG